jgi:hypothetical protein
MFLDVLTVLVERVRLVPTDRTQIPTKLGTNRKKYVLAVRLLVQPLCPLVGVHFNEQLASVHLIIVHSCFHLA